MPLQRIIIFLGLIFYWHSAKSQVWCGLTDFNESDKKQYAEIIKKNATIKNGRKGATYELYIKPNVIHSSLSPIAITTEQVLELVNQLNLVFSEINIRFLVENNVVHHIYDNEFYDLKTENDAILRSKYDSDSAINLYFTHTITRPDLSLLNGYSSLPNFSKRSNVVILSYLDNGPVSYSLLKEKIVPHEFGHYFGLLHTYHDSNSDDIKKRELVTRGIGANCTTTGDELCDTPADPFERNPALISLDCTEKIPSDILDFNGESYSPPITNYMSYHHKCEQQFTPMQFQRMESGLNIRLSSFAEYKITKNVSNFLSITDLNKKIYCKGDSITATFQKTGSFDSKNEFKVEISDKNGNNFREISGYKILSDKQIKIHIDQSWENGRNYRLIITSTLPYTESPISESFEIKSLPTAEIISSQKSIQKGEELQLNLKFGGSGPWSFKDWAGFTYEKINAETINFGFLADSSKLFFMSEISNACGQIDQIPSVFVEVLQPNLQILGSETFCIESLIDLPIFGLKLNEDPDYYQVQIKNSTQIFNILPKINANAFQFYLPQEIQQNKPYSMKVIGKKVTDFSNAFQFIAKNHPTPPNVVSPVNICFGTQDYLLQASGMNLKWYEDETTKAFTYSKLVNTNTANKHFFYVSQTDSNNCESKKSKIEVIVDEPVVAEISGSSNIKLGDSTYLNISLKGSAPWVLSIDPLGELTLNSPETKISVKPLSSTVYKLLKVSNYCGLGSSKGTAVVNVLSILGNSESNHDVLKVFPNPVYNQTVYFEILDDEISEVILFSNEGRRLKTYNLIGKSKGEIILPDLSFGKYILKFISKKRTFTFTVIK
jgi:hypothetical protein